MCMHACIGWKSTVDQDSSNAMETCPSRCICSTKKPQPRQCSATQCKWRIMKFHRIVMFSLASFWWHSINTFLPGDNLSRLAGEPSNGLEGRARFGLAWLSEQWLLSPPPTLHSIRNLLVSFPLVYSFAIAPSHARHGLQGVTCTSMPEPTKEDNVSLHLTCLFPVLHII